MFFVAVKVCDPAPGLPGPAWACLVCPGLPRLCPLRYGAIGKPFAKPGRGSAHGASAEARAVAEFWAALQAHRWRLPKGRMPDPGLHLHLGLRLCLGLGLGHTVPCPL